MSSATKTTNLVDITSLQPAWDTCNLEKYFDVGIFHSPRTNARKILPLMTSRGCPENCTYCSTHETFGHKVRWRSLKTIQQEIDDFIRIAGGLDEIQIIDDNVTANLTKFYELCDMLKSYGVKWSTPNGTKANYHMDRQLEYYTKMQESGCLQITIACETGNQNVMDKSVKKRLKIHEIAKAVENAKKAGLFVHTFWMVGLLDETRQEMEESMAFAAAVGADSYSVSVLVPIAGTAVFRRAVEENLFWDKNPKFTNTSTAKSLLKVDGFDSPAEFEDWVSRQNVILNTLLSKKDPKRHEEYENLRNVKFKNTYIKQT